MRGGALSFIGTPTDASGLADAIAPIAFEAERRREVLQRAVEAYRSLMRLTERERQVLDGIVSGESSKAIARELEISPRTVEIHRSKLLGKLGARNAADAVRLKVEAAAYTALAA
jgi:two-component system, LuxR family, response regulator FixJ